MRLFVVIGISTILVSAGTTWSDDFELSFPQTVTKSRPILEFRARKTHTFVFLGRELVDGTTVFYGAAGFYPQANSLNKILSTPGKVDYQIPDLATDVQFRVHITAEQEGTVKYIIKYYDNSNYSLAAKNCVTLVNDIASILGLSYPSPLPSPEVDDGISFAELLPYHSVMLLKSNNDQDTPLRHAINTSKNAADTRAKYAADAAVLRQHLIDHQKRIDEAASSQAFSSQVGQAAGSRVGASWGIPFGGSVKLNEGLTSTMTQMMPTWPWPEPAPKNWREP